MDFSGVTALFLSRYILVFRARNACSAQIGAPTPKQTRDSVGRGDDR